MSYLLHCNEWNKQSKSKRYTFIINNESGIHTNFMPINDLRTTKDAKFSGYLLIRGQILEQDMTG